MQYLTVFYASFLTAFAFETDLTVDVGPGKIECFFQNFKKPTGLEIEYQVALAVISHRPKYVWV